MEKETSQILEEVEISRINFLVDNHRQSMDPEKLKELADSIKDSGLKQPIKCTTRGDKIILVYGHRRVKASELAGKKTILSIVQPGMTDDQIAEDQVIENIHREDLSPIDEAYCVQVLARSGKGLEAAAAKLGKSETWCRERLSLLKLDPRILPFVATGKLPLKHALLIARIGKPEDQVALAANCFSDHYGYMGDLKLPSSTAKAKDDLLIPIDSLRSRIATTLRNLDNIKWPMKEPYGGRQACVGCAFNTRTQPSLFEGIVEKYMPKSNCANAECFTAKMDAWDKDPAKLALDEKEKEKKRKEKEARKSQPSRHYETYGEREKRVNAIKAKFPWKAEQKHAIAMMGYLNDLSKLIGEQLAKDGGNHGLHLCIRYTLSEDRAGFFSGIRKLLPTVDNILRAQGFSNKALAGMWLNAFGKPGNVRNWDGPRIDYDGNVKNVPLGKEATRLVTEFERICNAWKIKLPAKPLLSEFQDTEKEKPKTAEKRSGKPRASDLAKIHATRKKKKGGKKK